jgi:hypothetical protein
VISGYDLNMPSEAEIRREIIKQSITLARAEIAREKKIEGECLDIFYSLKLMAASQLFRYQAQAPELVSETRLEIQELLQSINLKWEAALEYERRNK